MKMRAIERIFVNSGLREYFLRKYEAPRVLGGLNLREGCRCLEIGCGNGAGALLIRRFTGCGNIVSIDVDARMVREAEQHILNPPSWARDIPVSGIEFLCGNAARLEFPGETFSGAFNFFVFEHIPDWRKVIREVFRVLKPRGIYSFEEGLIPRSPLLLNRYFGHITITAEELRRGIRDAGFVIERFDCGSHIPRCFVRARKR